LVHLNLLPLRRLYLLSVAWNSYTLPLSIKAELSSVKANGWTESIAVLGGICTAKNIMMLVLWRSYSAGSVISTISESGTEVRLCDCRSWFSAPPPKTSHFWSLKTSSSWIVKLVSSLLSDLLLGG
jgi:hypothetical protein